MRAVILVALLACIFAHQHTQETTVDAFSQFQSFVTKFNKQYKTIDEFNAKFATFKSNVESTQKLAAMGHRHQVGVTKFSDLTKEEFKSQMLGFKPSKGFLTHVHRVRPDSVDDAPASVDWRDKGAVTAVKDQGQCGSCWAFSAVANIEGQYQITTGKSVQFSEQELVSCDTNDSGCNGGLMENAFQWLEDNGALETTKEYPYTSGDGDDGNCSLDQSSSDVKVVSHQMVSTDETEIAAFLAKYGPLAVAMNAEDSLQTYTGGIIDLSESECDPSMLDHGVTIVGYGTENKVDYWIVKNSWNTNWGEDGYFRITRGNGTCGINTHVVAASLS